MKRLISLISLFVCCFAASAQPTSIGGITPGTTSREELKSLLRESDDVGTGKFVFGGLKQLAGQWASISLQNDVVYEVDVPMDSLSDDDESAELKRALLKKYGQPKIKIGAIRTVKCQNKFGASFDRVEGKQRLLWPVKAFRYTQVP